MEKKYVKMAIFRHSELDSESTSRRNPPWIPTSAGMTRYRHSELDLNFNDRREYKIGNTPVVDSESTSSFTRGCRIKSGMTRGREGYLIFSLLLLFLAPFSSFGARLVVSPANGTHEVGEKFTVRVIATSAVPFNAVSLSLLFPPSIFSLDSVSKEGSLLSFWVKEPTISNATGIVTLEGVAPGGIKELTGTVISVTMHGTSVGSGNVSFSSGQILANDGQGTDIIDEMMGAKFTILKAKTTPNIIPKSAETPLQATVPIPTSLMIQPEATLDAPEIMLGTKYGTQAIIGTTEYPKIQVLITFLSTKGVKIFIMGNADEDGSFALLVPTTLKQGNYTVTARVIQKDGLNSKNGNAIAVIVGTIISDIGWEIKMIFLFLFLLILYLIVRIIFHLRKDWKRYLAVQKEIKEARTVAHESLDVLKQDTIRYEQTGAIDSKKSSEMNHAIDDAEQKIEKEIKDIDIIE